jgi:acetyl-CoA carboxylase biotin carboxyl carrier protein
MGVARKAGTGKPAFDVDEALVRKLARLLEDTGLAEVEYAQGERRIRVARPRAAENGAVKAEPAPRKPVEPVAAEAPGDGVHPGGIPSPMVGTVYLQSQPGADPFVRVGDRVRRGDTLLIIEAMKVMNPIPAPRDGTVTEILVADLQPVEYGEVLMIIE